MAVRTNQVADKLKNKALEVKNEEKEIYKVPSKEENNGGMLGLLQDLEPEIKKALPEIMRSDRMIRLALSAWKANSKLKECSPMSFLQAVMQSSQLGLEPNSSMGEAYIIPRWNGKAKEMEAVFQIGYRGILSLATRTGQYKQIYAHEVYKDDEFTYKLGLHKTLDHTPGDIQEGRPTHFYAVYHLVNGGYDFVVWSTKKLELHASRYAQGLDKETSPWRRNFVAMAKKTVMLDLLKFAPKSIEFMEQLSLDNTVKRDKDAEPEKIIIEMEESKDQELPNDRAEPQDIQWSGSDDDFLNQSIRY